MRYKNIAGRFFGLVTKHVWQTDRQNYDSQDRATIASSCGKNSTAEEENHNCWPKFTGKRQQPI